MNNVLGRDCMQGISLLVTKNKIYKERRRKEMHKIESTPEGIIGERFLKNDKNERWNTNWAY